MKSKKTKFSCALLMMLILSFFCATAANASRLYITNHIIGDNADPNKEFEYYSRMVYHCTVCDAPFPSFAEYAAHHGVGFNGAHGGGGSWYTLDDSRKVVRKNGVVDNLGTGTHGHNAYGIVVMEPTRDNGGMYDIYYQVNDEPLQSLSDTPVFGPIEDGPIKIIKVPGEYPVVYVSDLPTDITKTYLTFYYVLPGASLPDTTKPETPAQPETPKPTLKPGAADNDPKLAADALYAMGLFRGTGMDENYQPIYELERTPTRSEAVTMLVRLLEKEEEAEAGAWDTPFTDLEPWAKPYVGYAYCNGLTTGTSATNYSGSQQVSASQYLTFVLRALGYESGVDFEWNKAWELSDKIGLTSGQYNASTTQFTRADVATISFNALYCKMKDSDTILMKAY